MRKLLISSATLLLLASSQASLARDLEAGERLFQDNCANCHGSEAQGAEVGGKLAGDAAYWDFPIFKRAVMEGIDDEGEQLKIMPVFEKTGLFKPKGQIPTDADLQDIQAYLKTFGPAE